MQHFLELCLRSVQKAIQDIDAEIIIVDNNSSDSSCEMIKSVFPELTLIENKENLGFSKGNNIGVANAKGEYICILNPDTVVAEDTFTKVLKFSESKSNLGIVGCRLIDGTGKYLPESKRNVPIIKVAAQKIFGNDNNYYANHLQETETGKAAVFVGAFMFLKKDVYNSVKGFDEDYFMYGEDIDISYKIINKGFDNYYFGSTTIIHYKGESTLKDANYAKRFYGAMQIFYKKHFKRNILFNTLVWLGIKLAFMLRKEPKVVTPTIESYALLFNKLPVKSVSKLSRPIELNPDLKQIKNNTEIIFDADALSYKQIIEYISDKEINSKATFKIRPNNSNFIIGSNSSKNRGEVIIF